ncbi:acyl-CoA dehydrogenase [Brevibacillus ruminantium]|uniref:acyl-CoA dehydrogenase n=1 Tax=Brevibacillus ruminantium TaxID=2950604 RepID=UPI0038994A55
MNGRKTFTTFAPLLQWFLVTASLEGTDEVVELLIPQDTEGVTVEETWSMVGMRGTASHDLVLAEAVVPEEALVSKVDKTVYSKPNPYLLHIPACYLGIAVAARDEAISFATLYIPASLSRPVIETPHVERLLGEIELELTVARQLLYSVAREWEGKYEASPPGFQNADLAAVKTFVVKTALTVVDKAMRIVGAHSLSLSHPLQRMYRDVRFGLHNPPMEDVAIRQLAGRALQRWEASR